MMQTIRKLPKSVQSLICASIQINSYTKAVQELIFNSLDADATSIAVRIHISEGYIQVVDNGCGISKADFKFIGQYYMTSKLVDIETLKSAPNKYGFKGQSIANLVQISEILKITSRYNQCETTYVKTFANGTGKLTSKCSPRPSKGTTIEIKGFLYNLSIQKKSIDLINELQSIKAFLEHVSLVHSSISLSLRDDSKNEIVYKIHKNRDVYQTLSALYDIEKSDVQELQVEKNKYKIKAYMGKRDVDIIKRFIFLNGKFVHDTSSLHKKINDNFKKHLKKDKKKIKKNTNNDEEILPLANQIPFYFMFITCPYIDYEMTNTVLEFKDWAKINIILDKLLRFYSGDLALKVAPKNALKGLNNKQETENTRNHIETIMRKILGSHSKKPDISRMQNGIKGKKIKRKPKTNALFKVKDSKQSNDNNKESYLGLNEINIVHETKTDKNGSILEIRPNQENCASFTNEDNLLSVTTTVKNKTIKQNKIQKKPKNTREISNKITTKKQVHKNTQITKAQKNIFNLKKKVSLNDKFAKETESVKRRCELLALKTEDCMKKNYKVPEVFISKNSHYTSSNFMKNKKNIAVHKKINEIIIHEYLPLPPKFNIVNQVVNNRNEKSFKSNYDLLQTVLSSQKSKKEKQKDIINIPNDAIKALEKADNCLEINERFSSEPYESEPYTHNIGLIRDLNDSSPYNTVASDYNLNRSGDLSSFLDVEPTNNHLPLVREVDNVLPSSEVEPLESDLMPYLVSDPEDVSPYKATFQSHTYYVNHNLHVEKDIQPNHFYKKRRNFITTQSRENFMTPNQLNNIFLKTDLIQKKKLNWGCYRQFKPHKRNHNKSIKMLDMEQNTIKGIQESYTIEFTESNGCKPKNVEGHNKRYSTDGIETPTPSMSYIFNESRHDHMSPIDLEVSGFSKNESDEYSNIDYEPIDSNTFTKYNSYRQSSIPKSFNHENWNNHETYSIEKINENLNNICLGSETLNDDNINKNNTNFVFVSKSEENFAERQFTNPLDVCETVLNDQELSIDRVREFDISFNYRHKSCTDFNENSNNANDIFDMKNEWNELKNVSDPHFPDIRPIEKKLHNTLENTDQETRNQDYSYEVSHHFTIPGIIDKNPTNSPSDTRVPDKNTICNESTIDANMVDGSNNVNDNNEIGAFNLRKRLCFVPKGMSPIFKECQTKVDFGCKTKEAYYEDNICDIFLKKIQNEAEIFKPSIQEASDLTTKDISKVNTKLNKDKASLIFDGLSIKNANVLGQVDTKFIAAIMKGNDPKCTDTEEFLVLFDQHAVHERIRLECNLADYLNGSSQWKSVLIDEVSLKMPRDDILYLHNYRDKFTQFGLEWNIHNFDEITITAIPEAILGKNPRQVQKIIKAVKNLITEEKLIIQAQRGCISLQPKSIMDLVFSEACRYAIKFGDHLSKGQCIELLKSLSDCKTPFQCAHGRPVMAVIMNMERNNVDYKINFAKLKLLKK